MKALAEDRDFDLINPRTREKVKKIKAKIVFDLIVNAAWLTGDPGLIFLDEINRKNPTPLVGPLEATNPCGELPLLPYESCNLGSINLGRMVKGNELDWKKLAEYVRWGVRFLDDVIEVNQFPLPQIKEITFANRKIGLGVMGFADLLIRLGIPYGTERAVRLRGKDDGLYPPGIGQGLRRPGRRAGGVPELWKIRLRPQRTWRCGTPR